MMGGRVPVICMCIISEDGSYNYTAAGLAGI